MKAIRIQQFGGPEVMRLETIEDPRPGAGEIVVSLQAIGVNPVDSYIRSGGYGPRAFPFTPGFDAAGTVKVCGTGVTRFKPGDRVYVAGSLSGTYAEQALCKEFQLHPLPPSISFEQGAAMGVPYTTAYYALFYRGHAIAGETVLVHGASGGVGTATIQIARARGLQVIGTAGTDKGRELVIKEGAHHALNHRDPEYLKQVMPLTNGLGVNLILEMLANVNLGQDLKILAKDGRVIVIGSRGPVEIDPRDLFRPNADIRGLTVMNATENDRAGIHAALVAGLENGTLRPIIGQKIPLAEASRSHEALMQPGAHGKIVLIP